MIDFWFEKGYVFRHSQSYRKRFKAEQSAYIHLPFCKFHEFCTAVINKYGLT